MSTAAGPKTPSAVSNRFEIRGYLGAGGMGTVYRAYDAVRRAEVAVKALQHRGGLDIYRFKREFRALADIAHPNLVTLYELHTAGDEWFFTMELIDGESFIEHLRPSLTAADASAPMAEMEPTRTVSDAPPIAASASSRERILGAPLRLDRLEPVLHQLADGVHALHLAGKLHRDLKPSNVLIDGGGRLVLLDFGLITDLGSESGSTLESTAGTPAYMSPEQAAGQPLTEASDWYSVGIMLYEALTGRRPFEGLPREILAAKQTIDPPPPRHHAADVPPHLDALCAALIRRDPAARADATALYAALGRAPSAATLQVATAAPPFVGRVAELAALREALADSRRGAVAVFVSGQSGMGKSALLRQFLDEVAADPATIVLEGRCYERESVPFNALDAVVDALADHLARLPADATRAVVQSDALALARAFPVLRRVPAVQVPAALAVQPADPAEVRRRAFAGLRHLLERLAAERPVVIAIDDLQWGDADSAAFLADLLAVPAPPILLIAAHRSEEADRNVVLTRLRRRADRGAALGSIRELAVGRLSDEDALALLAEVGDRRDDARAREVVRDCGGSPFFLTELGRSPTGEAMPLEQALLAHVARLPDDARALLRLCAVAARPITIDVAVRAAGLPREGGAIATLRVERLVRVRRRRAEPLPQIEPYHDRIRETVVAALDPAERRDLHRALAVALEAVEGTRDHEALVAHWLEAGELARAGHHAALAAVAAEEALAFHRAAQLWALALEHGAGETIEGATRRAVRTRMGHCLVYAGSLHAAADAFAAAAADASHEEALELRRLEVEARLRGGEVEAGMAGMRQLLDAIGFRMPASPRGAIASILGQSLLLRLRPGLAKRPRVAMTPAFERRVYILLSLSTGMAFINPVMGRVLQLRLLRDALASGHKPYYGLATSMEPGYLGTLGTKTDRQREDIRRRGLAIADELGDPMLRGWTDACCGLGDYLSGHWRRARERFLAGLDTLRSRCVGVRWQIDMSEIFLTATLWSLGDTAELVRLVPALLRDAQDRGDRLSERGLRSWRSNVTWLVLGRPDEAAAHVEAVATPRKPGEPFHVQHYYEMLAAAQNALYRGDGDAAHARVARDWPELEASMILRVQIVRIESWYLRARTALAAASAAADPAPLLAIAEHAARTIERDDAAWGHAVAAVVRATVAHRRGDDQAARAGLESAIDQFVAADMALFALAARRCLGAVLGGEEGSDLIVSASAAMSGREVADPAALTRMMMAGWEPR